MARRPTVTKLNVPLPDDWSVHVKLDFLTVISLAHRAITVTQSWCVNSRIARVRLAGDNNRLSTEVSLLREELRIKDARLARIPPASRPHYPPTERLAILALKAARAWNNSQAAKAFLVTASTIAHWQKRLDEQGANSLIEVPVPVNRYPDFVTLLVQQLKSVCPIMGRKSISQTLARAGLHLSASTVKRMLSKSIESPENGTTSTPSTETVGANESTESIKQSNTQTTKRVVTAKHSNHVWHIDLSTVPTSLGFWVPWFANSLSQVWPFCYWVFIIVDNYSRKAVYSEVFRKSPTAIVVTKALDNAIASTRKSPKYIVSDRGPQFRNDYMAWCKIRRIKPRFGAIGQHGSIAIVERFIRCLKTECTRRIVIPLNLKQFYAEITLYLTWYNEHRPHSSLGGRTPNEVSENRIPAKGSPRFETRPRESPTNGDTPVTISTRSTNIHLDISYLEGRKHLPIVSLRSTV
jgi:putative transposase